jgi:hypothetical protein
MRRALVLCVLVAGCGGGGSGDAERPSNADTAPQAAPSSVEVSLRGPDTRRVVFGHPLELAGVVRPTGSSEPRTVRLLAEHEPVDTTRTGEGGSFSFTVRPRLNTVYSVEVDGRASRRVRVYAMPDQDFRVEPLGPRRGILVLEMEHPPEVTPTDNPAQFYVHFVGDGGTYTRVGEAHLDWASRSRAVARLRLRLHRAADDSIACLPSMFATNFGDPPIADCGKRRVRPPRRH